MAKGFENSIVHSFMMSRKASWARRGEIGTVGSQHMRRPTVRSKSGVKVCGTDRQRIRGVSRQGEALES